MSLHTIIIRYFSFFVTSTTVHVENLDLSGTRHVNVMIFVEIKPIFESNHTTDYRNAFLD